MSQQGTFPQVCSASLTSGVNGTGLSISSPLCPLSPAGGLLRLWCVQGAGVESELPDPALEFISFHSVV